ncbi:MAG TPA: carboxypeptidase-like regulatory domain-containing protein [Jiangellales bacterium]|nr:carboxypeptidase-like regulatory domain-containing protein [Jiangellales bacterium]
MTSHLLRRLGAMTVAVLVAALGVVAPAAPAQAETDTGTISGHVTRPDGSPAAYEWINAEDANFQNPGGFATTDENGFYAISELVPGSYRISIRRGLLTQYAHGKNSLSTADLFTVTAGATTTVDEQLLALGVLQVTVTEHDGTPAQGAVSLHVDEPYADVISARLDESGQASLDALPGGYRVKVIPDVAGEPYNPDYARAQWLFGKTLFEQGDSVTVTSDTITTVSERLLTPGSVRVTARDSVDGTAIAAFCASVEGRADCSDGSGVVDLIDLRPGSHVLNVYTDDGRYFSADPTVTVVAGETVSAVVELERAASITSTVVDAATGQPVAGACLVLAPAGTGRLPDGSHGCSGADGRVTAGQLQQGAYNLFVRPPEGSGYGAQWVGSSGGTGDAAKAREVAVEPGAEVVVPPIKLDRAGAIAGVVTSAATGQPVTSGVVSLSAYGRVGPSFATGIDESGRYTLDWLGPYEWPLLFTTDDHARQWSGGVADRREAKRIKVHAGRTSTYNPALKVGAVWTGSVTDAAGSPLAISLDAVNAATGDTMDEADSDGDGRYRSLILGSQTIKIRWTLFDGTTTHVRWYDGAADFEQAKPVDVPKKGTLTLDMVIATG